MLKGFGCGNYWDSTVVLRYQLIGGRKLRSRSPVNIGQQRNTLKTFSLWTLDRAWKAELLNCMIRRDAFMSLASAILGPFRAALICRKPGVETPG
jgi:hypothetical protein